MLGHRYSKALQAAKLTVWGTWNHNAAQWSLVAAELHRPFNHLKAVSTGVKRGWFGWLTGCEDEGRLGNSMAHRHFPSHFPACLHNGLPQSKPRHLVVEVAFIQQGWPMPVGSDTPTGPGIVAMLFALVSSNHGNKARFAFLMETLTAGLCGLRQRPRG